MEIFLEDKSTIIWFVFTLYVISAIFLIPSRINLDTQQVDIDTDTQQPLKFASRFVLRIALIFPMLILLQNVI